MLKYLGVVKGVKTVERKNKNNGEIWNEYFLGLSEPKTGGYGGEEIIHDIKLTKQSIDAGMDKHYETLVGKKVEVSIFVTARAWNNNAYIDWIISGEGRPISVDGKPAGAIKAA